MCVRCLCTFDVCTQDAEAVSVIHVCVMHVTNRDEQTDGKLDSRSRMQQMFRFLTLVAACKRRKFGFFPEFVAS